MSLMEKELIEMTGQFLRLVSFNKNVFGTYYGEIIENMKVGTASDWIISFLFVDFFPYFDWWFSVCT